jgi:hypothetical protein
MSSECCSICLNSLKRTRQTRVLECEHMYHTGCLEKWESSGGDTCPLCRKDIHKNRYKVTITIENLSRRNHSTLNLDEAEVAAVLGLLQINLNALTTEIEIDVGGQENLEELMGDLGFGLSRFDSAVLHTE